MRGPHPSQRFGIIHHRKLRVLQKVLVLPRHRAEREFGAIMGMLERCGSAVDCALTWISQTRTYQGGEPGRHLHFSGTQDLVCW